MRGLLVLAIVASTVRPSDAGVYPSNRGFEVGEVVETTPPGTVEVGAVIVERGGVVEEPGGCGERVPTTCDAPVRFISIEVAATDNMTPVIELGYRVRIVSGVPPVLDSRALYDRRVGEEGVIRLLAYGEETFDCELGIAALDGSGNVGPETVVRITADDGSREAEGCAVGRDASEAWAMLWLAALGVAMRRRGHAQRTVRGMVPVDPPTS